MRSARRKRYADRVIRRLAPPALLLVWAVAACGKTKVESRQKVAVPYAGQVAISSADPALRWINTEGGGAGWLPRAEKDEPQANSFMMVDGERGVRSVLAEQKRAAIALDADALCGVVPLLAAARDRISLDISLMKPITPAVVGCLRAVHPPAFSFTSTDRSDGALAEVERSLLTQLQDCEALGVHHAGNPAALLLGERAASPDGAALRSLSLPGSSLGADGIDALAKRRNLRAVALRGMGSPTSSKEKPGQTGLEALAKLPDLERLDLSYTAISDAELAAFANAKALRWLMLESTNIGDAGIARLAGLRTLEYLNLSATKVTEAGLEAMVALPSLRALAVPSAVAVAAVARWRKEHPLLHIDHYPPG